MTKVDDDDHSPHNEITAVLTLHNMVPARMHIHCTQHIYAIAIVRSGHYQIMMSEAGAG